MVLSMERWIGQVAVVTGASAGIGSAIAAQLVDAGLKVVGLARRFERLEELGKSLLGKKGSFHSIKCDVSIEEDILNAFKKIKEEIGPVAILINNAGILQNTNLIDGDTAKWRKVFDVNVLGLTIATREAIKSMRENGIDGHVIHINSIAGHYVDYFPFCNVYHGSKHAVTALTEFLRQELIHNDLKIKVTSVSPGAVATEMSSAADITLPEGFIVSNKAFPMLLPEDIADAVSYALSTPKHVQVHEIMVRPVGGT